MTLLDQVDYSNNNLPAKTEWCPDRQAVSDFAAPSQNNHERKKCARGAKFVRYLEKQVGDKSEDFVAATIGLQYILNLKRNLGIGSPRILNF